MNETTTGTERPILFSGVEVRAILDGHKTQMRRVMKLPAPAERMTLAHPESDPRAYQLRDVKDKNDWPVYISDLPCPYGRVGDRLWVRETWQAVCVSEEWESGHCEITGWIEQIPKNKPLPENRLGADKFPVVYAASDSWEGVTRDERNFPWKPSNHMPRWASRITLEIIGVRVERLQDISEADAQAEGACTRRCTCGMARDGIVASSFTGQCEHERSDIEWYRDLWDSINAKRGHSFGSNPWVWALEFRRVTP